MHKKLVLMYGSHTGTAESIAQGMLAEAQSRHYDAVLLGLDDHEQQPFTAPDGGLYVIVCSSTGDGDAPDNATKCFRYLRKLKPLAKTQPFAKVEFALLGLGDTNYSNFCGAPLKVQKYLKDLGAEEFYAMGKADDAVGLEEVVDPWIENLWPVLEKKCARSSTGAALVEHEAVVSTAADLESAVAELQLSSSNLAHPPVFTLPAVPGYTFGKLAVPDLPATEAITTLTNLPKLVPPTVTVTPTGTMKPVDSDPIPFYSQFASPITKDFVPPFSAHNPTLATVSANSPRTLSSPGAVKTIVQLDLQVANKDHAWDWVPGDAFGVCTPNQHELALALAVRLGLAQWNADKKLWESPILYIHGQSGGPADLPLSLRDRPLLPRPSAAPSSTTEELPAKGHYYSGYELFRFILDIHSTPKKALWRHPTLPDARVGRGPGLLHVLESFPNAHPTLPVLLAHCPPLTPRYYSHTNTPLAPGAGTGTLQAVFNIVEYAVVDGQEPRSGLASKWLANMQPGTRVPVFPHLSNTFHLPAHLDVPMIMIGPGTGIAPILGMLRHRARQLQIARDLHGDAPAAVAAAPVWVFQGCRDPAKDWIAGDEMKALVEQGVISRYVPVFSRTHADGRAREQGSKYYVQDALREHAGEMRALLEGDSKAAAPGAGLAKVYLCGDAKSMAKGVMDALVDIVAEARGVQKTEAIEIVMEWVKGGRYLQDLW
ncbi:hypothetical protein BCR44DRAFT_1508832 [Catenaria anguillulae PL171]|uniref:Methionine synthase reductase n=1 Tax=Catenaria anguillulae PL171 TaxID=765915 RepID=A0A1Y2I5U1_9FUNG|nr:hypothetical protein BCR44DRAFT_1508832 [Catenaria anguillulae PL171]